MGSSLYFLAEINRVLSRNEWVSALRLPCQAI